MAQEFFNNPLFLDANLVSYWRLNGNSNDTKLVNNGTDTDMTYSLENGKFYQGAGFNGTSSKITVAANASLNLADLSILVWFKRLDSSASTTNQWVMLSKATDNNIYGPENYFIRLNSGADGSAENGIIDFGFRSSDNTWKEIFSVTAITDTNWHNVIATRNNTTGETFLYLDGVQESTDTLGGTASTGDYPLYIGRSRSEYLNGRYFKGSLDEIIIFNRVLSASEVLSYYNAAASSTNYLKHYRRSRICGSITGV